MEYKIMRSDELYHYGVPGMRWGHRKAQPTSLAGTGHRAMAGVYGINQRFYNRTGNDFKYHTATRTANSFENLSVNTQRTYDTVRDYARAKKRYTGHY